MATEVECIARLKEADLSSPERVLELVEIISEVFPSPKVLALCLGLVPIIVAADLNMWKTFLPRPTSGKSALRFMESCIDRVGLWPDSGVVWTAARKILELTHCEPSAIQKLYVRQIQAVPIPLEERLALRQELDQYTAQHGLSAVAQLDASKADQLWKSWSALENQVVQNPVFFGEMIEKRKALDPPEIVAALYARSVVAMPGNVQYWKQFVGHIQSTKEKQRIMQRAVKCVPSSPWAWAVLAEVSETGLRWAVYEEAVSSGLKEGAENLLLFLLAVSKLEQGDSVNDFYTWSVKLPVLASHHKQLAALYLAWVHAVAVHFPNQVQCDQIIRFICQTDSMAKVLTPLQWVQLAWTAGRLMRDRPLTSIVYAVALTQMEEKHHSIILQDQMLFCATVGELLEIDEKINAATQKLVHSSIGNKKRIQSAISGKEDQIEVSATHNPNETKRPRLPEKESSSSVGYPTPQLAVRPNDPIKDALECTVFVKDLPFSLDEKHLAELFSLEWGIGNPKQVLIVKNHLQRSRGFGYVEFESKDIADKAIEKSGAMVQNRPISIVRSSRPITMKRQNIEAPEPQPIQTETMQEVAKNNDYFRNLISQKQKVSRK